VAYFANDVTYSHNLHVGRPLRDTRHSLVTLKVKPPLTTGSTVRNSSSRKDDERKAASVRGNSSVANPSGAFGVAVIPLFSSWRRQCRIISIYGTAI
jgi:hypothetical protein